MLVRDSSSAPIFKFPEEVSRQLEGIFSHRHPDIVDSSLFSTETDTAQKLNGGEIAEALQSEAAFTHAVDPKPIVATYGCGPCVGIGGYEETNKMAFIAHFYGEREVILSIGTILSNISRLTPKKFEKPIQIHLRGGIQGRSEKTIEAIKKLMQARSDLPMAIASEDTLREGKDEPASLMIDSRTGSTSEYICMQNPYHRNTTEVESAALLNRAYFPRAVDIAYAAKIPETTPN